MTRYVVRVGMARQQDLNVGHLEAERLDRFLNQGDRALKAAVDEDMPLGSGDEIGGQVLGTDVVNVADDLVSRKGLVPIALALSEGGRGERQRGEKHGKDLPTQRMEYQSWIGQERDLTAADMV